MKKRPKEIVSILLNCLNNLDIDKEYTINEISEKAGLHWYTTNDYLEMLKFMTTFAPKISINKENNKLKVTHHSDYYNQLSLSQRILIYLFENKAFDESSAKSLDEFLLEEKSKNDELYEYIDDLKLKEQIESDKDNQSFYITRDGKEIVHLIYQKFTNKIFFYDAINQDENNNSKSKFDVEEEIIELKEQYRQIMCDLSDIKIMMETMIPIKRSEETDSQVKPFDFEFSRFRFFPSNIRIKSLSSNDLSARTYLFDNFAALDEFLSVKKIKKKKITEECSYHEIESY